MGHEPDPFKQLRENPVGWFLDVMLRRRLWKQDEGQSMVEYALLAGFVGVAAGATLPPIGREVERIFRRTRRPLRRAARRGTPTNDDN